VSKNLEDGYERGDITAGLKDDRAWYCGSGMMGIRAVARFAMGMMGVPIPDACKVLDRVAPPVALHDLRAFTEERAPDHRILTELVKRGSTKFNEKLPERIAAQFVSRSSYQCRLVLT